MRTPLRRSPIRRSWDKLTGAQRLKRTKVKRTLQRVQLKSQGRHASLVKQLDELARAICMAKHGAFRVDEGRSWHGACAKCGLVKPLQWCHFTSRRIHSLRWEPDNAVCLCAGCHYGFAHHQPGEFVDWMLRRIGETRMARLSLILKTKRAPDKAALRVALQLEWAELQKAV